MSTRSRIALAAALSVLALAGCSSSDSGSSTAAEPYAANDQANRGAPAIAPEAAQPGAVDADAQKPAAGGPGAQPAPDQNQPAPVDERSLIYTGSITIKVDSVQAAADRAIATGIGAGGFVSGDNRTIDDKRSQATLILRVPADRFTSTLDALAKIGQEQTRQVNAQDVTDQLVDLNARVATQEASVSRVRDLLARAQTIAEITSLETELTRRQADLDSLKQRREKLSGLVALATITVVLLGPEAAVNGPAEPETGFLAGLKAGWKGFLASVKIVLTIAGWLLPWAIAIGLPLWGLIVFSRRRRRPRPVPAGAAPSILTPATPTPAAPPPPSTSAPSTSAPSTSAPSTED
jgi:Domain of unknown function (DUF4349)